MPNDDIIELVRRATEEPFNQRNLDLLDEVFAADAVDHKAAPNQAPGVEGIKQAYRTWLTAFPRVQATLEGTIVEGDRVAARVRLKGTNTGSFRGLPPTDKEASLLNLSIFRIEDRKIAEWWHNDDDLGILVQAGIVPIPVPS